MEKCMKKLFALAAISAMLSTTGAIAACPCQQITPIERVSYIQPVTTIPVSSCCNPCCDPCSKHKKKTNFFGHIINGTKTVYDATFGNLYNYMFVY